MACVQALNGYCNVDKISGDDPYSLVHFLPVGTVLLPAAPASVPVCDAATSHWHPYYGQHQMAGIIKAEDNTFLRMVDFLVAHKFIAVMCKIGPNGDAQQAYMRIYLIPYDLANVEGVLRRRDELQVLSPARIYLRVLLLRMSCDRVNWEGKQTSATADKRFFDDDKVSVLDAC